MRVKAGVSGLLVVSVALLAACRRDGDGVPAAAQSQPVASAASAPADPRPAAARPRIVVLGDSITAGLGLPVNEAFPARLQRKGRRAAAWLRSGQGRRVGRNLGGRPSSTRLGARRRRASARARTRRQRRLARPAGRRRCGSNLSPIIARAKARGITRRAVRHGGPAELRARTTPPSFARPSRRSRARRRARSCPFLLAGVAGLPEMNQADGIHPNAAGARRVADTVWAALGPLLVIAPHHDRAPGCLEDRAERRAVR